MLQTWKDRARALKLELQALLIAYRDPRTPWLAKLLALLVLAYAFSPLDLIPDFIPVLGYLDDLLLLPLGIWLVLKLLPPQVMAEARTRANHQPMTRLGWLGAGIILLMWGLLLWGLASTFLA